MIGIIIFNIDLYISFNNITGTSIYGIHIDRTGYIEVFTSATSSSQSRTDSFDMVLENWRKSSTESVDSTLKLRSSSVSIGQLPFPYTVFCWISYLVNKTKVRKNIVYNSENNKNNINTINKLYPNFWRVYCHRYCHIIMSRHLNFCCGWRWIE